MPAMIHTDDHVMCSTNEVTNANHTDEMEHLCAVATRGCRSNTAVNSRNIFEKVERKIGVSGTGLLEVRTSGGAVVRSCRCNCCKVVGKFPDKLNSATSVGP